MALDTSGYVTVRGPVPAGYRLIPHNDTVVVVDWASLPPFAQGYIEAFWEAVRELRRDAEDRVQMNLDDLGFRHLAPEALALILKDCAEAQRLWPNVTTTAAAGASLWHQRQMMALAEFGPVTPYLREDGKIAFRG